MIGNEKDLTEEVKFWIEKIREISKEQAVEHLIMWLRELLKKADIKLEDIGSSEKELKRLQRQGYLSEAKHLLGLIREEVKEGDVEELIRSLKWDIQRGGLRLREIKTSSRKLRVLLKKGYTVEAKNYLELSRDEKKEGISSSFYARFVKDYLERANTSEKVIGTNQIELLELQRI